MEWKTLKRLWHIEVLGGEDKPFKLKRLYRRLGHKEVEHYLFWFRLAQYLHRKPHGWLNYPKIARRIHSRLLRMHRIDIMLGAEIGAGLILPHRMGIVIADVARIGENVMIRQNTTIGVRSRDQKGLVYIGDNVELGANVCIIGDDLRIGNNVTIGAMAMITKDVPDDCIAYTRHISTLRSRHELRAVQ